MSFLAPLFLLGAAAIALPVAFHLIRKTTRIRIPFSSLLFLPPSPPRVTQRSRLEDLLLLALRCLVIALLALGFSRPFFKASSLADPSTPPPARILLLVDTSASMQRQNLWADALSRVTHHTRAAAPSDELAVWTFDRQSRPLVTFRDWNGSPPGERPALVNARLADTQPGWFATHLDDALAAAAEHLLESSDPNRPAGPRRVILISDLQEGARLDRLQSFDWPRNLDLAVDPVTPRRAGNASLHPVPDAAAALSATQSVVRIRIHNSPDATRDAFQVGWARSDRPGFAGRAEEVQVPPGQSRTLILPVPTGMPVDHLLLDGDDEPFDNRAFIVPPAAQRLRALYFGSETTEDPARPLFFLRRAFPPAGRFGIDISAHRPSDPIDPAALSAAALYFATEALPPALAQSLRDEVHSGKTLLFAPTRADAFASLGPLLDGPPPSASEATVRSYALLGSLDFRHPFLLPFADPRFSDFSRIHFWKHRRLDETLIPGARVVARFDSGDPAWIECPRGRGRIVLFTSGWHPEDSQLALSTKFVPLLLSMVERAGGDLAGPAESVTVGDPLPLPPSVTASLTVRLPRGESVSLPPATAQFEDTTTPGIYEVRGDGPPLRFAVNVHPAESRTHPHPLESLEAFGAPVRTGPVRSQPRPEQAVQLAALEAEGRQKLWRWLLVAALAALFVESALAGWRGRRSTSPMENPT